MSRSKHDVLDTERMLARLVTLLADHGGNTPEASRLWRPDAEALRRISMTLHAWHEHECNGNIQRGRYDRPTKLFTYDDNGAPYWFSTQDNTARWQIPDREAGALKRLEKIMARYPALQAYVQGDPRGCALYILKPGDVPDGADVSAYYNRGLAVYR